MLTVLAILGWILLGIVLLLVLFLCTPIHLQLAARSAPDPEVRLRVRLFSGQLPPVLSLGPGAGAGPEAEARPEPEPEPARTRAKRPKRGLSPYLRRRLPRLIGALPGLIADTVRGIHLDHLRFEGRVGLGDPAETGQLYGQLCPLIYTPLSPRLRLSVIPDFDRAVLEGEGDLALHLVPIRLAWPTIRTGWRIFVLGR